MNIEARADGFSLPLQVPIATARGTIFEREGYVIVVNDEEGHWGRGEVAPLPGWSAIDHAQAGDQVAGWVEQTNRSGAASPAVELAPEVRAGVDTALWSLHAARSGLPLWRSLTAERVPTEVEVNALIVGATPHDVALAAAQAIEAGYTTLKVKLGMGDDSERLAAVADVTPNGVSVRLDANGAWSLAQALHVAAEAASALGSRLEYIEDPVGSLDELEHWRSAGVAAAAVDELVRGTGDLERVVDGGLAEVVVVKPAMLGGISPVLELAALAASAHVDVVVSSLYDGPVGLSAWCHLAAAIATRRAHGLGTAALFAPGTADQLLPQRGVIKL